jgi:hypothetical protein
MVLGVYNGVVKYMVIAVCTQSDNGVVKYMVLGVCTHPDNGVVTPHCIPLTPYT